MTVAFFAGALALLLKAVFAASRRPRRWGSSGHILVVLFFIVAAPWLYITAKVIPALGREQNTPAPHAQLILRDSRQLELQDLSGKVLLLDFWATWCVPCRASEPAIASLTQHYAPEGLLVIRVSGDADEQKWRRYLAAHPSSELETRDADDTLANKFGVGGRPVFVLVDRGGNVRWQQTGWTPFSYAVLRLRVRQLLSRTS